MSKELYLIKGDDGYYYIISKSAILVTELTEIQVGVRIQFIYPELAVKPKVRKGEIIMESETESVLKKEMDRLCSNEKRKAATDLGKNVDDEQRKIKLKKQDNLERAIELGDQTCTKKRRVDCEKFSLERDIELDEQTNTKESCVDCENLSLEEKVEEALNIAVMLMEKIRNIKQEMHLSACSHPRDKALEEKEKNLSKNDSSLSLESLGNTMSHLSEKTPHQLSESDYEKISLIRHPVEDESVLSLSKNSSNNLEEEKTIDQSLPSTSNSEAGSTSKTNASELALDIIAETGDKVEKEKLWMMKVTCKDYKEKTAVELVKRSGIFIHKSARKMSESKATSAKTLARSILINLFMNEAILTCTLSGKGIEKKIQKEKTTLEVKKGGSFPHQAIKALLVTNLSEYVHVITAKMKWTGVDDNALKQTLRDKLKEMKNKHKVGKSKLDV